MSKPPAPAVTATAFRPKSREELIRMLGRRWLIQPKVAAQRLDVVLDLVLDLMREQRMDYDYGAGELFSQLLKWKGERP